MKYYIICQDDPPEEFEDLNELKKAIKFYKDMDMMYVVIKGSIIEELSDPYTVEQIQINFK